MSVEVREHTVHEHEADTPVSTQTTAAERHEHVEVHHEPTATTRTRVVENVGAAQRARLGKGINFIWLLAGILEMLIGLRVVLKLIAANPANAFAQFVYQVTDLFLWPFFGLTATPATESGMVLEISSIIAMLVYAVAAWAIVRFVALAFSPSGSRTLSVYERERKAPLD